MLYRKQSITISYTEQNHFVVIWAGLVSIAKHFLELHICLIQKRIIYRAVAYYSWTRVLTSNQFSQHNKVQLLLQTPTFLNEYYQKLKQSTNNIFIYLFRATKQIHKNIVKCVYNCQITSKLQNKMHTILFPLHALHLQFASQLHLVNI